MKHARLSPSSAHGWLRCPQYPAFAENGGEDDENEFSARGTILHHIAEQCLVKGLNPYKFVGEIYDYKKYTLEIDDEMAEAIQAGIDRIEEIAGKLYVETRVNLGRWMPGQFGTADVGIIGKRKLTIFDWKFGMNPVSPIENEQEMLYGLGFWDNIARHITDIDEFHFIIWQPFAPRGGGEWSCSLKELLAFGDRVREAANATYDPDMPAIAGDIQCKYCVGAKRGTCPAYEKFNLDMVISDFDDLDEAIDLDIPPRLQSISAMTPERRSHIVKHAAMIKKYLERLYAQVLDDAQKGLATPTLKAVWGNNPPRKWKDKKLAEERMVKLIGEDAYRKQILTVKMTEGELPAGVFERNFAELIDAGEPKPILVDEKDARPAITNVVDMFDDD